MSIPLIYDGQTLIEVRTRVLNPVVDAVNGLDDEFKSMHSSLDVIRGDVTVNTQNLTRVLSDVDVLKAQDVVLETSVNNINDMAVETINEVNVLKQEDEKLHNTINGVSQKVDALDAYIKNWHEEIATTGKQYKVDYRVFDFTSTNSNYSVVIPLEAEEYPVRAVVRTFENNTGTFNPVSTLSYNRTTKTLTFNVGNARSGKIYCEFWGPV